MKRKMLGVFGLGVFGGTAVMAAALMSGCFAPFLALARADDAEIVKCANGKATFTLPDEDPSTYVRVSAVRILSHSLSDGTSAELLGYIAFRGATANVTCGNGESVAFSLR